MPLADRKSGIPHETETYRKTTPSCEKLVTMSVKHFAI